MLQAIIGIVYDVSSMLEGAGPPAALDRSIKAHFFPSRFE